MLNTEGPKNPGKVLTWSVQLGLSATVYLMRERVTEETKHLYYGGKGRKGVKLIWEKAREEFQESKKARNPDAKFLQNTENNIRKSFNRLIFNTSVRYGNTEVKRKRRKEDRKYINILLDYLGSRLRDFGATMFKFPSPPIKEVQDDGKIKRYYPGNSTIPKFKPTHTAPEQDFMDMIRSHGIELVRQCLNYSVPRNDAKKYVDGLMTRLIPYLEWVYTERRTGKKGFLRGSIKELRTIVKKIQAHYGKWNGRPQSVTGEIRQALEKGDELSIIIHEHDVYDDQEPLAVEFQEIEDTSSTETNIRAEEGFEHYWKHLIERCSTDIHPEWETHVTTLKELCGIKDEHDAAEDEENILTVKDVEYLYYQLLEESRRIGIAFHDFIANSDHTFKPFSLRAVVKYGDTMLTVPSEYLLISEVYVANGRGRIDLILFRRKIIRYSDETRPEHKWEPCMLIEIKTKSAFELDLYAVPTRSKKHPERRVVHFEQNRRKLTEEEWDAVITSTPIENTSEQLKMYEQLLISEYKRIARTDSNPPNQLRKAVLVMDSKENWELVRDSLQDFVIKTYEESMKEPSSGRQLFQLKEGERKTHASLVVFDNCEHSEIAKLERVDRFDPFRHSKNRNDTRKFTLYYSVSGKGSSQKSAAQIAANWHGLQHIYREARKSKRDVIWLDFTGEHSDFFLRKYRLHTNLYQKPLRKLLKWGVFFNDLSHDVISYISGDHSLKLLTTKITQVTKPDSLIIITGLDAVRGRTPSSALTQLNEFILHLINIIPDNTSVIWFDRPVPLSQTSQLFDTRCVAPFYSGSPWMYYVDEIIWNLPMPPPRYMSFVPADDDIRVIAIETPISLKTKPTTVPPLYKWGERFRADKDRDENFDCRTMFYLKGTYPSIGRQNIRQYDNSDITAALELVPHLLDYSTDVESSEIDLYRESLPVKPSARPKFLSMTSFTPYQTKHLQQLENKKKKPIRLEPLEKINHSREYRQTRLYVQPPKVTTRPPHFGILKYNPLSELTVARKELSGIRRTIKLLISRFENKEWRRFLRELGAIINPKRLRTLEKDRIFDVLREVSMFLETHDKSSKIWKILKSYRLGIPNELGPVQQDELLTLLVRYPNILMLVGNQFFLLLIAALDQSLLTSPKTGLVERLWERVISWQLMTIGFIPVYHSDHRTGKSVLHREKILDTLTRRARTTTEILENCEPSEILFGRVIPVISKDQTIPSALWLFFESKSGSHEMNASLVPLSRVRSSEVTNILQSLARDRPYWGETNLAELSRRARNVDLTKGVEIMIATHQGLRGLWVREKNCKDWTPVGRIQYWTRKKETVTLLGSFSLRKDSSQTIIRKTQVRSVPVSLKHSIDIAIGTIDASFRECKQAQCKISLNRKEKMFFLEFYDLQVGNQSFGKISVKHTRQVLEILRRPDFECEPVVINENRLVWNRFKDIQYEGDAGFIQPWVERKNPFPTTDLSFPNTAGELINARRKRAFGMKILHEIGVCPHHAISTEQMEQYIREHGGSEDEYLRYLEGSFSQPDHLQYESIHGHGKCWRAVPQHKSLPERVQKLNQVLMNGHALASLLRAGALLYKSGEKWVIQEFDIPDISTLPKEFRDSFSIVEAYRDLVPSALKELERTGPKIPDIKEQWQIDISYQSDHLVWVALSDITSKHYDGTTSITVQYEMGASLEQMMASTMSSITYFIPKEDIFKIDQLKDSIHHMLINKGFKSDDTEDESYDSVSSDVSKISSRPQTNTLEEIFEYTRLHSRAKEFKEDGELEESLVVLDKLIQMLEAATRFEINVRAYLMTALMDKVDILVGGKLQSTVSPNLLLESLDRLKELSKGLEGRLLKGSRSEFSNRIRWHLTLRENIRKKTN